MMRNAGISNVRALIGGYEEWLKRGDPVVRGEGKREKGEGKDYGEAETRTLYALKDYSTVREDVGYHLELTGVVDEKTKTISVRGVKRLNEIVNVCALPKKT